MINIFEYLFYKFYRLQVRIGNKDDAPMLALMILSASILLYSIDILILSSILFNLKLPFSDNKIFPITFSIIVIVILHFSLYYKGKYKKIIQKYQNESEAKRRKGNFFSIAFVSLAYIWFVLGCVIKMLQNRGVI